MAWCGGCFPKKLIVVCDGGCFRYFVVVVAIIVIKKCNDDISKYNDDNMSCAAFRIRICKIKCTVSVSNVKLKMYGVAIRM